MVRNAPRLAIVVPCLNEAEVLPLTHTVLQTTVGRCAEEGLCSSDSYILYIDDGSADATWEIIRDFCEGDGTAGLRLTSNSGHQNAILAGLAKAREFGCDAAVSMDADLQDDPAAIAAMLRKYLDGAEIVYGIRQSRKGENPFKKLTALGFYRLRSALGTDTVYNHADFRLLSSAALDALSGFRETNLYLRGIVPLLGMRQESVYYDRRPRPAGKSKYPFRRMVNLAADGITSFSVRPVRMIFGLGIIFLLIALGILIYALLRYFHGQTIEGWTSIILSIWTCTGILLMSLGVIGEYLGKVYMEVKRRPRYQERETIAPGHADCGRAKICGNEILLKTSVNAH